MLGPESNKNSNQNPASNKLKQSLAPCSRAAPAALPHHLAPQQTLTNSCLVFSLLSQEDMRAQPAKKIAFPKRAHLRPQCARHSGQAVSERGLVPSSQPDRQFYSTVVWHGVDHGRPLSATTHRSQRHVKCMKWRGSGYQGATHTKGSTWQHPWHSW